MLLLQSPNSSITIFSPALVKAEHNHEVYEIQHQQIGEHPSSLSHPKGAPAGQGKHKDAEPAN